MDPTPWVLAVLGVVLAGPVPALLARARWLRRTPLSTMLLWQGVALAAVLSALGAGLSLATSQGWSTPAALALAVTAVVAVRLGLAHPLDGAALRFEAVPPPDLLAAWQAVAGPAALPLQ